MTLKTLTLALTTAVTLALPCLAQATPGPGMRAPALSGPDMTSGQPLDLASYNGKWVLVDFWASWCQPCLEQLPEVESIVKPYRESGRLSILSVNCDSAESKEQALSAALSVGIADPVIFDGLDAESPILASWGVSSLPEMVLVNPDGVVVYDGLHAGNLSPLLEHFIDNGGTYVGLSSAHRINEAGQLEVEVSALTPFNGPLDLTLALTWGKALFDPADPKRAVSDFEWSTEESVHKQQAKCNGSGNCSHTFVVPLSPDMDSLDYIVMANLPGGKKVTVYPDGPQEPGMLVDPAYVIFEAEAETPGIELVGEDWTVKLDPGEEAVPLAPAVAAGEDSPTGQGNANEQ